MDLIFKYDKNFDKIWMEFNGSKDIDFNGMKDREQIKEK